MTAPPLEGPKAHPRPQLVRERWRSLDGFWDFALDPAAGWSLPDEVRWSDRIRVPFAPETTASGIGADGFFTACWYRLRWDAPRPRPGERVILHFGAVDYAATVWIDGTVVMRHSGGHTPFRADVTALLPADDGAVTLVVRAEDDPHDLAKPRGKQDWQERPHAIWYPRTSGIWQTVWCEIVPGTYLKSLRWTSSLERWEVGLEAGIGGRPRPDLRLQVRLRHGERLLADDTYAVVTGELARRIALPDPGIDDYRNELLWSPSRPTLLDARLRLWAGDQLLDDVASYAAIRSVGVQGDRFILNGRPFPLRLVLDQGYWPATGMTAPDDEAIERDVVLAKLMGFNGVRKHQKLEDPRYLHMADRFGLLVWEEMPSAYRFTRRSVERLTREWIEAIERDLSHPCIVAWVPFNESWGVPDLPDVAAQRHAVQALYHLTKTLDPSRPVIGNDGWESSATDIVGIHDYEPDPARIGKRYESEADIPHLFRRERPGGRLLTLEGYPHQGQPIVLTEFGGIALSDDEEGTWGYDRAPTAEAFLERYRRLLSVVRSLPLLAGFCYTQFADTYQEANGLLHADRRPKAPLRELALATAGMRHAEDDRLERAWQARLLSLEAPPPQAPE